MIARPSGHRIELNDHDQYDRTRALCQHFDPVNVVSDTPHDFVSNDLASPRQSKCVLLVPIPLGD